MKVIAIDLHQHRLKRARDFGAWVAVSANDTMLFVGDGSYQAQHGLDAARITSPSDAGVHRAPELVRGVAKS